MKEATNEQWRALYQIADELHHLKPWERFGDLELIGLTPKGFKDPFFVSIMGMESGYYGFLVYMGYDGFKDFARLAFSSHLNIPEAYAFFEQTYLSCRFVEKSLLSEPELTFMEHIGMTYSENTLVPVFESAKKGYCIDRLDELAVILMTHLMHELKKPLMDVSVYDKTNYSQGEYMHYKYDEEKGICSTFVETLPRDLILVDSLEITDQLLIKKMRNQSLGLYKVELDVVHFPMEQVEWSETRLPMPKMVIICDSDSGNVLKQEMIGDGMDESAVVITALTDLIMEKGRMSDIFVCNTIITGILDDFCEKTGIRLEQGEVLLQVEQNVNSMLSME